MQTATVKRPDFLLTDVPFIPQAKKESCWYACAQMLIQWRRKRDGKTTPTLVDPSEDADARAIHDMDTGLEDKQLREVLIRHLGLRAIPPMSPTERTIERWLRDYGPLYVNCVAHAVVMVGIRPPLGPVRLTSEVRIYDPSPRFVGKAYWRALDEMFEAGPRVRSEMLAVAQKSNVLFLYSPPTRTEARSP